jgi:hypothetical protein
MTRFDQLKPMFWDRGPGEPLSGREFAHAGRELGVRLPIELGELLGLRNGGTVAAPFDAFPTSEPTSWSETHVPFDQLLGVGAGVPDVRREAGAVGELPGGVSQTGVLAASNANAAAPTIAVSSPRCAVRILANGRCRAPVIAPA